LDRLQVVQERARGRLSVRQAAELLGLSGRGLRKLMKRFREQGEGALMHALRGRASKRKIRDEMRLRALELIEQNYADYGPTLAAEMLQRHHDLRVSRETLRGWMKAAGLWRPRRLKPLEAHVWRPRRSCLGELAQWDTSEHDWLEGRGPKLYLIALIDDATSTLTARFALHDSTEENLAILKSYVERQGRPQAVYTDRASLFETAPKGAHHRDAPELQPTQIGRALRELDIRWIGARTPQAKGRVERCFQTAQDRLVKGLRRAGAETLQQARQYLEEFVEEWNERFRREPAGELDAHRPLGLEQRLESICSVVESRQVMDDYTLQWEGRRWRIPREQVRRRMKRARVRVERWLNGERKVNFDGRLLELEECVIKPAVGAAVAKRKSQPRANKPKAAQAKSRWMEKAWFGDPAKRRSGLASAPVALRAPSAEAKPEEGNFLLCTKAELLTLP
jgi:transposase